MSFHVQPGCGTVPIGRPAARMRDSACAISRATSGCLRLPIWPTRRRQVERTDEHQVDALDREDRVDVLDRLRRLDLAGDQQVVGAGRDVVARHAVARRAHRARRRAAASAWRIQACGHRRARFVGGVDARDQHRLRAGVEHALQVHVIVPRDAHDADRRRRGHRVELRGERRRIAEPVLLVEHEEVVAGEAQDLDDLRIAEHRPAAEHVLAVAQALLEAVWADTWHLRREREIA